MITVIRDLQVARKILEQLGLPAEPLPLGGVEPQHESWPTGPPCGDFSQAPAPETFE